MLWLDRRGRSSLRKESCEDKEGEVVEKTKGRKMASRYDVTQCEARERCGRAVYIPKHIINYFENEIKPTWRERQILNKVSGSGVG